MILLFGGGIGRRLVGSDSLATGSTAGFVGPAAIVGTVADGAVGQLRDALTGICALLAVPVLDAVAPAQAPADRAPGARLGAAEPGPDADAGVVAVAARG